MKKLITLMSVLALSGYVTHNFNEGERQTWRCAGDKEFSLRRAADAIEAYASGQTFRLTPSSEGEYSDGTATYSVDHDRASLTGVYGGPFENCRQRNGFRIW